ncbi:MAG TPA: hypothetical protein VFT22_09875 [Kofleriaceae bacterium]|nr:hypothetical protein [Kofleriaceae bacterium]
MAVTTDQARRGLRRRGATGRPARALAGAFLAGALAGSLASCSRSPGTGALATYEEAPGAPLPASAASRDRSASTASASADRAPVPARGSEPRAAAIASKPVERGAVEPFHDSSHPYVQLMTPMPHATYFAPATIRMWAHAPDTGSDNVNGYSPRVDFYLGAAMVKSVAIEPRDRIDDYEANVTGVAAGSYELYARSYLASGVVESVHVPITVIDVPPARPAVTLARDLILHGNQSFELIGAAGSRALITSSNGSRIKSAPGWTGHLTIRNADLVGLGGMDVASIEVVVAGNSTLEIAGAVFDRSGPLAVTANGKARIAVRGNTFRPNMLVNVNSEPNYAGSHPSIVFAGDSTAPKLFAGNNVGVSFVRFDRSSHWLIGGDHDADGNVLIGVRAGLEIDSATDLTIRGNYSYHRYPFGWSQGHNLDFEGTVSSVLVEHNVFRSGSWIVQNLVGQFRYNLVLDNIDEAFIRYLGAAGRVHHNVFANTAFQRQYLPSGGVLFASGAFYSNTVDAGGARLGWFDNPFMPSDPKHRLASVRNNVFTGFAYRRATAVVAAGAAAAADYNCFYNPDTSALTRYGDAAGFGEHDCGHGASTDPRFAEPRVIPLPFADGDVWARRVTVSQILSRYREIYTPQPGSPLIDSGDPGDDAGGVHNTDIGAVDAGNPHPDDRFGRFGP